MLAIAIKTFMREESLFRLLNSIDQFYPEAHIYIADDSDTGSKENRYGELESNGHTVLRLPFDVGLSAGRNALMEAITEEFVLYCDDDYILSPDSGIYETLEILKSRTDIDIITGVVVCEGNKTSFEDFTGGWEKNIRPTLRGVNFFLARTKTFKKNKWNPEYKINKEHADFFNRFKGKVYFCPDLWCYHEGRKASGEYANYRNRMED